MTLINLVFYSILSLLSTSMLFGATLVVTTGKAIITNRIRSGGTEPLYLAWGTGAGTTAAGDTTLFSEASESRVTGTSSQVTTSTTNDTYQVVGTMTVAGAGKTITNMGLFDASTSGNLFMKTDFTGVALNVGEGIQMTMKAQLV